ncbi:zinc finger, CCHC-type containing protein, partial [Tanacetum coccineum]
VEVYDAYRKEKFQLRAMIFCTISDFPAYGNLSGYSTKGKLVCPVCEDQTSSRWLPNCRKTVFMRHRRSLEQNHRYQKKEEFNGKTEYGSVRTRLDAQDALSQDLEYWEHLDVRHCLDVMHIEKNVAESLIELAPEETGVENIGIPHSRHEGRILGVGTIGLRVIDPDRDLLEVAHSMVLQHMTCVAPYIEEHMEMLRRTNPGRTDKWIHRSFRTALVNFVRLDIKPFATYKYMPKDLKSWEKFVAYTNCEEFLIKSENAKKKCTPEQGSILRSLQSERSILHVLARRTMNKETRIKELTSVVRERLDALINKEKEMKANGSKETLGSNKGEQMQKVSMKDLESMAGKIMADVKPEMDELRADIATLKKFSNGMPSGVSGHITVDRFDEIECCDVMTIHFGMEVKVGKGIIYPTNVHGVPMEPGYMKIHVDMVYPRWEGLNVPRPTDKVLPRMSLSLDTLQLCHPYTSSSPPLHHPSTVEEQLPSEVTMSQGAPKKNPPKKLTPKQKNIPKQQKDIPSKQKESCTIDKYLKALERRPMKIRNIAEKFINKPKSGDFILVRALEGLYEESYFDNIFYDLVLGWMSNDWLDGHVMIRLSEWNLNMVKCPQQEGRKGGPDGKDNIEGELAKTKKDNLEGKYPTRFSFMDKHSVGELKELRIGIDHNNINSFGSDHGVESFRSSNANVENGSSNSMASAMRNDDDNSLYNGTIELEVHGLDSKGFLKFFDCLGLRQGVEDLREVIRINNRAGGIKGYLQRLLRNMGFNESDEYKKTLIGSGVGTSSMQVLHGFEFEVEPLGDHTFEVEPQENVDQGFGLQEVQTRDLIDYQLACDMEQHLACELCEYREDRKEAAFAISIVDKIYAHELLTFNDTVAYEVISKWKAVLKEYIDVRSDVFYNKKLVHTLLEGHSILSLEGSLSRDYDVEKNGKWSCIYAVGSQEYQMVCTRLDVASADVGRLDKFDHGLQTDVQHMEALLTTKAGYMTFIEAWNKEIWLQGLLIESRYELRLVAGIATGVVYQMYMQQ